MSELSPARAARTLLRLLRAAQPISRVELARRLGLDRSTVTDTLKPLVAAGVVLEDAAQQANGAGRGPGRRDRSRRGRLPDFDARALRSRGRAAAAFGQWKRLDGRRSLKLTEEG